MGYAVFYPPHGKENVIEDLSLLKEKIIGEFDTYWLQGSGAGFIEFFENNILISTLMLGPNKQYGIYLRYIDERTKRSWLSLFNNKKLNEVAETSDEIYASIGLFLPIELAWEGIEEFILTGKMNEKIQWIIPDAIPEEGNW